MFRLDDQKVDMIMTPRSEIIWLDLEDDIEVNKTKIIESKRSIFPVADAELDDFIGVVQAKDILSEIFAGKDVNIRESVKSPLVVPENMLSMDLLKEYQDDDEMVRYALECNGSAMKYVNERYIQDRNWVRLAIEHSASSVIMYLDCMEKYRGDKELVYLACKVDPWNITKVDKMFRDDYELVQLN